MVTLATTEGALFEDVSEGPAVSERSRTGSLERVGVSLIHELAVDQILLDGRTSLGGNRRISWKLHTACQVGDWTHGGFALRRQDCRRSMITDSPRDEVVPRASNGVSVEHRGRKWPPRRRMAAIPTGLRPTVHVGSCEGFLGDALIVRKRSRRPQSPPQGTGRGDSPNWLLAIFWNACPSNSKRRRIRFLKQVRWILVCFLY